MATITEQLAQATAQLCAGADPRFGADSLPVMGDDQLCGFTTQLEILGRLVDCLRVTVAAEVDKRSRPELGTNSLAQKHGHVRAATLLEYLTRISNAEAARRIRLGAAIRADTTLTGEPLPAHFPAVEQAFIAGDVGVEAAASIVRCLGDARRSACADDLAIAESALVRQAILQPADCVADLARVLRDRLDPDGVRPREEETRARRGLRLGRERHGVTPISGGLEPVTAALFRAAFSEANAPGATPRFLSEQDQRDGTETTIGPDDIETVTVRDPRSREQRQHDVFAGLLKAGIRNTGRDVGQLRSTADVTAVILLSDLEAGTGPGWLDGVTEPVSANTVEQREYNSNGRHCTTDIDNGVLLCGPHRTLLHRSVWRLRMRGGTPELLAPLAIDPAQTWRPVGKSRITAPPRGHTG